MIQSDFIKIFLEVVDNQSTIKQKYLDISFNQQNQSEIHSISESQFDGQSFQRLQGSQSKLNEDDIYYKIQHPNDFNKKDLHKSLQIFQKQNVIKNILKSFLRYLNQLNDINIKKKYQSMFNSQNLASYSEIKKSVSRKVNEKTARWNFKLNSVIQSLHIQPIFYDYLTNVSKNWVQKSKVSNILEHEALIDNLIQQIEIEKPLKIKIYKKKR
ncbi:hypothetical protein ABPG74_001597 [Tetrahymena malaccensis]